MIVKHLTYKNMSFVFGAALTVMFFSYLTKTVIGKFMLNEESKASYALGQQVAEGFLRQGLSIQTTAFVSGLNQKIMNFLI